MKDNLCRRFEEMVRERYPQIEVDAVIDEQFSHVHIRLNLAYKGMYASSTFTRPVLMDAKLPMVKRHIEQRLDIMATRIAAGEHA